MKFDKTTAPEALDYDFTSWGVDAQGSVPEPTRDAMGTFLDFWDDLTEQNQKATEVDLQAKANALQEQVETGKVTVTGVLPDPDVSEDPEQPAEPEPEVKPERRTAREIVLGDDEKAREWTDHIAGLCQNQPTGDQMWDLPPRIRSAFIQMVIALFLQGDETGGLQGRRDTSA